MRLLCLLVACLTLTCAEEQMNFKAAFDQHLMKHSAKLQAAGMDTDKIKNVSALLAEEADEAFDMFVQIFRSEGENGERIYNKLDAEWNARKNNFVQIFEMIARNNVGNSGFKMAINQFADFDAADAAAMRGLSASAGENPAISEEQLCEAMPTTCKDKRRKLVAEEFERSLDWSTSNNPGGRPVTTGVVNQGKCDNCWVVSATAVMESRYALDHGTDPPLLAMSQVTNCWAHNCNPGNPMNAYTYAKTDGLTIQTSFPFDTGDGRAHKCRAFDPVIQNTGMAFKSLNSNEQLLKDILKSGPTVLAINAFHKSRKLIMYKSGIFDDRSGCAKGVLDHAVVAVGYGEEDGKKYWKIRNSWGPAWGEGGYFRILRSSRDRDMKGLCGIVSQAYMSTSVDRHPAAPPGALAAGMPVPCQTDLSVTDSRATCSFMFCKSTRNAECRHGKCVCKKDHCSNQDPAFSACRPRTREDGPIATAPPKHSSSFFSLGQDGDLERVPGATAGAGASGVSRAALAMAAGLGMVVGGFVVVSAFVVYSRTKARQDTPISISADGPNLAAL